MPRASSTSSRVSRRVTCGSRMVPAEQPGGSTEKATLSSRSPAIARVASASAFLNGSAGLSAGLDMG